jgi:hypothetical protein
MRSHKKSFLYRRLTGLLPVALLAVFFLALPAGPAFARSFPLYDALLYSNKPDLTRQGLTPIRMIYSSELWADGESRDKPNGAKITALAKQLDPALLTCVDIEHWPTAGKPELLKSSIAKYTSVLSLIRQQRPSLKLAYYSIVPRHDYWRAVKGKGQNQYDEWLRENIKLKDIGAAVDVILPDLYTFYPDQAGWEKYAIENLKEARKYGKPVYAFLWPMYHDSEPLYAGKYIPADFWRFQLETCLKYADGIVIWGGWQEPWNENAPWWIETKKFMQTLPSK